MADFAEWGEAVVRALGHEPKAFLDAYEANRHDADALTLDASSVAVALLRWWAKRDGKSWQGTATDLLKELNGLVDEATKKAPGWPKGANALAGALKRLAPNLRRRGLDALARKEGHERRRVWWIGPLGTDPRTVVAGGDEGPSADRPQSSSAPNPLPEKTDRAAADDADDLSGLTRTWEEGDA
jgi:hypothetical protein